SWVIQGEAKVLSRSPPCHLRQREMASTEAANNSSLMLTYSTTSTTLKSLRGQEKIVEKAERWEQRKGEGGCNESENDDQRRTSVKQMSYKELSRGFQGDLKQKMKWMMCSTIIRNNFGVMYSR